MATLYPSWQEIDKLIVPPTDGERSLLQFLDKTLDDSYEVYFQPNFNGIKPDIVIIRKRHGVVVIEVKDWNLYDYSPNDENTWLVYNKKGTAIIRSPFLQAKRYKEALYEFPLRLLTTKTVLTTKYFGVMQAVVFFSKATHKEVDTFGPFPKNIYPWTVEDLTPTHFRKLLGIYMTDKESKLFTDDLYEEMYHILHPSLDTSENYKPVILDKKQQQIVSQIYRNQKVKGVAGSGKTQVLAHKAIELYLKTYKPVLILVFNITLRGYIHDRINQARYAMGIQAEVPMNAFTILHYHAYAKLQDDDTPFESILVDEVQDFKRKYIENIWSWNPKHITFFCDEKQNIYSRHVEEDKKPYTGIKGEWNVLNPMAYRIKNEHIVTMASTFQQEYIAIDNVYEPLQYVSMGLFDAPIYYSQLEFLDVHTIYQMMQKFKKKENIPDCDICFLSPVIEPLRILRDFFSAYQYQTDATFETQTEYHDVLRQAQRGILPHSIEETVRAIRRSLKFNFWAGSGKLKFSTIHSFKGWQIPAVILILDNTIPAGGDKDIENADEIKIQMEALLYTGITRAEQFLYIIEIGDSKYTPFFKQYTTNL